MIDHSARTAPPPRDEIQFLSLAAGILRHWKWVVATWLLVVAAAAAFALTRPKSYTAQTVVLPATESRGGAMALLAEGLPPGLTGMAGAGGSSNQKMVGAIVASRSLADSLVARLAPRQGAARAAAEQEIRQVLAQQTRVKTATDGSVTIRVSDREPERAARIANEVPELVNVILTRVGAETSLRRREMLEGQIAGARERLERSEQNLMRFQQGQDAPELVEQGRATVQAAAQLQQEIMQREVQVGQMRRAMTADHPRLRAAEAELAALRGQLQRLTSGSARSGDLFLPLRESPELKLSAGRLAREFKKDEQIYLSLAAQLASAQMDADSRLPVVSTLDVAVVPAAPSGPRLPLTLVIASFLGLLLGLIAAFVREYMRVARLDPGNAPFFDAWGEMKSDLAGIVPGRRSNGRVRV
jgi:uncharacterized protein involved in exopolysaccharide biosynthesis